MDFCFDTVVDVPQLQARAIFVTDTTTLFKEDGEISPIQLDEHTQYVPWGADNLMPYNVLKKIEALRPQVMEAVEELIRQRGLPKKFTGIIEYHGFKIRVQRPKSYTWELNSQIKDENLDYYKKQHAMYEQLQADVKDLRRDMKRTGEKLEKAYPDSESIKYGMTVAVMK